MICIYLKLPPLSGQKGVYNTLEVIHRGIFQKNPRVAEQLKVAIK